MVEGVVDLGWWKVWWRPVIVESLKHAHQAIGLVGFALVASTKN